jgi:hypothetical protein
MDLMKSFKVNVLSLLNKFKGQEGIKIIPTDLKRDLWTWKKCIADSKEGIPIRDLIEEPPLFPITIISDAAGAALEWVNGKSVNKTIPNDRGVASVWYCGKKTEKTVVLTWPKNLLMGEKSRNGNYFGSKSGTLEAIGLLLPFISYPKDLIGQHIVMQVDNTSLGFGWEKHYCKNDPETSLLIRTLHIIEAYLSCKIYIKYVQRRSTTMARLVDNLSRKSTTTSKDLEKIHSGQVYAANGALIEWLNRPNLDWTLPEKIIADISKLL